MPESDGEEHVSTVNKVSPPGSDLEREAEAHLVLGQLLRKKRPADRRNQLRRIMQSNLSIDEKVAEIRKLDAEGSNRTESEGPQGTSRSRGASPLRYSLAKLKTVIKLPHTRVGLLACLFGDYARIVDFGLKTHTIAPVFLFPLLRLDRRLQQTFAAELQSTARELQALLRVALDKGWQIVTKKEFNLMVVLDRLCEEILATNFGQLDFRDTHLSEKLRALEALFFVIHYRSEYRVTVVDALQRSLAAQPHEDAVGSQRAGLLASLILDSDRTLPSLYNFIVMTNMIMYRRLLTLRDLIATDLGQLVAEGDFACEWSVRVRIESYVEDLKRSILVLDEKRRQIDRVQEYVQTDASGAPDFSGLQRIYERGLGKELAWSFARDRENVVVFVPRILRLVDATFTSFLAGQVTLATGGKARIFGTSLFQTDLQRLRNVAERFEHTAFDFRILSYHRYLEIKRGAIGAITVEAEIIRQANEALSILLSIAGRLEQVRREPSTDAPSRSAKPIEPSAFRGKTVSLPHASGVIRSRSLLNGVTVEDAIRDTIAVFYLIVAYLYDRDFLEALAQGEAIKQKLDSQLETLKRIGGPGEFDEVSVRLLAPAT